MFQTASTLGESVFQVKPFNVENSSVGYTFGFLFEDLLGDFGVFSIMPKSTAKPHDS